ncbi:MAG: AbrB/MazE/SpoVT family DNA-binding domain-containing protein [Parvularculaceae bacterium]
MTKNATPPNNPGFAEEAKPFAPAPMPLRATTVIGRDGRIVIPAAMREAMGAAAGSTLMLLLRGDRLEVFTPDASLRRIRESLDKVVPHGVSLADELIADRRREAAEEDND